MKFGTFIPSLKLQPYNTVDNIKQAKYTRKDNDANIMAINGNMPLLRAKDITDVFLKTPFSNEERHKRRIEMLDNYKN